MASAPPPSYSRSSASSCPPRICSSSKTATIRSKFLRAPGPSNRTCIVLSRIVSKPGCARFWRAEGKGLGERNERWRNGAAQQGLAGLPLRGGFERVEELDLAAGKERDWQTVSIEEAVPGQRGEFWPRGQNAGQVERVRAGQRNPDARLRL